MLTALAMLLAACCASLVDATGCPMGATPGSSLPTGHAPVGANIVPVPAGYAEALANMNFDAVKKDLMDLFKDSKDFWPADYGHYGPFMIRLAWHCAGSYRKSDGRGGCDGGRQRFDPERSWDDNTNLDKARRLLWPIKEKYGLGLSWGDLFILAGTTAIEDMGGPVLGFCAGRIDDADGTWSQALGPTPEQEANYPCETQGECKSPLGPSTVGLIYVNPEGVQANPVPENSVEAIRDTFGRMAMNDSETVALIGGGHAFGKTHGACTAGPGEPPNKDPANPWPGLCGDGKLKNAFTSGLEGPWTSTPINWNNQYFSELVNQEWEVHTGPGGKNQWKTKGTSPQAPGVDGGDAEDIMMLTTDVALTRDDSYNALVKEFAEDQTALEVAFAHAWYKLTTRDMGPVSRCAGDDVPPAQPWQYPLPPPPAKLANFKSVRADIASAITTTSTVIAPDTFDGQPYYGALFVRLAWQCASTYRQTDYLGGCNGARLRYDPEMSWPINADLDKALDILAPIKSSYGDGLTWADLIVLAGNVALEQAGGNTMTFCGGRSDADDGAGSEDLSPTLSGETTDKLGALKEFYFTKGLTAREMTALQGGGHTLGMMHVDRSGFQGAWTSTPTELNNEYFKVLLAEKWEPYTPAGGKEQYKASGKELYMLTTDLLFTYDPETLDAAQAFAADNDVFLKEFAAAWTKMMNADRFDGPTGSVCGDPDAPMSASNAGLHAAIGVLSALLVITLLAAVVVMYRKGLIGSYKVFDS